jgi:sugar phosphate isomerase/epimerase
MNHVIGRRRFLKSTAVLGLGAGLAGSGLSELRAAEAGKRALQDKKVGWKLCCGAYSFNQLTFFETVDQAAALAVPYLEAFTWQPLAKDRPGVQTNTAMSAADREATAKKLADTGVKLVACYCQKLESQEQARPIYDWAKQMGIETFIAEPPFEAYDAIEKLCDEYAINLAVHNHPQPSQYWNPATVLKVCQGRSKRIGACCDTGHWVRSGFQPVEAMKLLEGRILWFHLKDVDSFGRKESECVPWGTGKGDVDGILKEMHRQGYQGYFGIEYEPYSPENAAKIAQCVAYFDKASAALAG